MYPIMRGVGGGASTARSGHRLVAAGCRRQAVDRRAGTVPL